MWGGGGESYVSGGGGGGEGHSGSKGYSSDSSSSSALYDGCFLLSSSESLQGHLFFLLGMFMIDH